MTILDTEPAASTAVLGGWQAVSGIRGTELDGLAAFARHLKACATVTEALQTWRFERGFGTAPVVAVRLALDAEVAPDATVAAQLGLARDARIIVRRVALKQADQPLAFATNRFVPERLPVEAVRDLRNTDVPFGRLLAPYGLSREPLPPGLSMQGERIFQRALIRLADGPAIAVVEETFLGEALLARRSEVV